MQTPKRHPKESAQRECIGRALRKGLDHETDSFCETGDPNIEATAGARSSVRERTSFHAARYANNAPEGRPPSSANDSVRRKPSLDILTAQLLTRPGDRSLDHFIHTEPDRTRPPKRPDKRRFVHDASPIGVRAFPPARSRNRESHTRQALQTNRQPPPATSRFHRSLRTREQPTKPTTGRSAMVISSSGSTSEKYRHTIDAHNVSQSFRAWLHSREASPHRPCP